MRTSLIVGLTAAALLFGCDSSVTPAGRGPADAASDTGTGAAFPEAGGTDLPPTPGLFQLIDDMDHVDDGFPSIPEGSSSFFWAGGVGAGLGNWFVSRSDRAFGGDASIEEIIPPRGDSKKACHMSGSNLEKGADLWAQLDHPTNRPVNLSAYAGIAFWARLTSPSGRLVVAINDKRPGAFLDTDLDQSPWPWLSRRLSSGEWERVVLLFDDFRPGEAAITSGARTLDSSGVISIDFVAGGGGEPFDLWIDDLMLLCRGGCQ